MLIYLFQVLLGQAGGDGAADQRPSALQRLESARGPAGFTEAPLEVIVANIIFVFLSLIGLILLALIVYGGFIWMKARGNEQEVEKAREILTNAIIGLIIVLAAYAISAFVVCGVLQATGAAMC